MRNLAWQGITLVLLIANCTNSEKKTPTKPSDSVTTMSKLEQVETDSLNSKHLAGANTITEQGSVKNPEKAINPVSGLAVNPTKKSDSLLTIKLKEAAKKKHSIQPNSTYGAIPDYPGERPAVDMLTTPGGNVQGSTQLYKYNFRRKFKVISELTQLKADGTGTIVFKADVDCGFSWKVLNYKVSGSTYNGSENGLKAAVETFMKSVRFEMTQDYCPVQGYIFLYLDK